MRRGGKRRALAAVLLASLATATAARAAPTATLVKDINPGSADSDPSAFGQLGGIAFFGANDGVHGSDLWKSDGTAAGTKMVKDINPGSAYGCCGELTTVNDTLFFVATDVVHGMELWKSDGTAAGTVRITDLNPGNGNSFDRSPSFTSFAGKLFFRANDG